MAASRLPSDLGGTRLGVPVDREEHDRAEWEVLTDGVLRAVRAKGLWRWDEGRRATEDLGQEYYDRLGYYQRRVLAMETLMVERGMVTVEELNERSEQLPRPPVPDHRVPVEHDLSAEATTPAFRTGQRVRIADRWPAGHVRTPAYVRGKQGRVVGVHGPFRNPETLAYRGSGLPARWLYTVEFFQSGVWDDYDGSPADVVVMDIYEQWIEPLEVAR